MSFSLADQLLIQKGDSTPSKDFALGRLFHVWIYVLKPEEYSPPLIQITASETPQGSVTIILESDQNITLYRHHILRFNNKFVVVKRTTVLIANVPTETPVFELISGFSDNEPICATYPLIPLFSIKEGGFPQPSANLAEAHNKSMGLYSVSQKYKHDSDTSLTGELNYTDPALPYLEDIESKNNSNVFIQVRPVVTEVISLESYRQEYGSLAIQYRGVATVKLTDPEGGMVALAMDIKINGQIDNYLNMFPLPAIISIPGPSSDLLLTFHDGSIVDSVTPSRTFTLDANAYVGYPYTRGSKFANTSLVAQNNVSGLGCYTSDVTGISDIGGTGVDYCVEFWAGNLAATTPLIRLLSTGNIVLSVNATSVSSISIQFHTGNWTLTTTYPRRAFWNHYALVRSGNTYSLYYNGVLVSTSSPGVSNRPITDIQLGYVATGSTIVTSLYINYFLITRGVKYTGNFDPVTGTGLSGLYYYPENNTEYCV
jgi:hypothetical protein